MKSSRLLEVLDVVLADMPAVLVPPERIPPLRQMASLLAPSLPVGLELRLASDGPVDMIAGEKADGMVASRLAAFLADRTTPRASGWDRIEGFVDAWRNPATPWRAVVQDYWLEFDLLANPISQLPLPAVFVGFGPDGVHGTDVRDVLDALLDLLLPAPLPSRVQETLRRSIATCPERGRITHLGAMLSRLDASLRLNVAGVPTESIGPYLEAIEWPGSTSRIDELLERLFRFAEAVTLAIDVGPAIGSRLGLECALGERSRRAALLEELVRLDCCSPAQRDVLVTWPRVIVPSESSAPWPAALITGDIVCRSGGLSAVSFGLTHVKIDVVGSEPLRAKAYVYLRTCSLAEDSEERLSPKDESDVLPAAYASRGRHALDDAIEGALVFLSSRRAQSGLWRDFSFEGGSDEWVSGFVGSVVAESGLRPRDAEAVWHLLARRSRPGGGWGYSAITQADSDSTIWGLKLGIAVGCRETKSTRGAEEFLGRHQSLEGGLATYLAEDFGGVEAARVRGWTGVHTCVTAAGAALPGAIGEGCRRYLLRSQRADGSWSGKWWTDDAYTTGLAAEGLAYRGAPGDAPHIAAAVAWAGRRVAADGSVTVEALDGPSPFATAWVARTLALGGSTRSWDELERTTAWLVRHQCADGSWASSADLWIPLLDSDPAEPPSGIVCLDERRIFTTAAVLGALVRAKRVLERSADPEMKRPGNGSSAPPSRADAPVAAPQE